MNHHSRQLPAPPDAKPAGRNRPLLLAVLAAIGYLVASILWITLSDALLFRIVQDPRHVLLLSQFKGIVFVTLMATLVGLLVYMLLMRVTRLHNAIGSAARDSVTGFGNRLAVTHYLHQLLQDRSAGTGDFALLLVGVRNLRRLNATMGRTGADTALRTISGRIDAVLEPSDTLSRLESDRFVVLLPPGTTTARADAVAQAIVDAGQQPLVVDGIQVPLRLSVSVLLGPGPYRSMDELLDVAETSLHRSETPGSPAVISATGSPRTGRDLLAFESDLAMAVEREQFRIHLQPQFALDDGRLTGAEALLRWDHPVHGLLSPGHFIRVAEANGLNREITRHVLSLTCALCGRWKDAGLPPLRVGINLSGLDVMVGDTPAMVQETMQANGIQSHWLSVEITESALVGDPETAMQVIGDLQALGLTVAIDDFGTGYSSLSYLTHFLVDQIKVDRSFVTGAAARERDVALLRALKQLAAAMHLDCLAEGVESEQDLALLRELDFDTAQGYLLGRPVPPAVFLEQHLDRSNRWVSLSLPDAAPSTLPATGSPRPGDSTGEN